jgi:hypothetical protein
MRLSVPVAALALAAAAAPASADAVIDRLKSDARGTPVAPFERTSRTEQPKRPPITRVDRFDPKAPEGRQWTLVSVDGRPPTADEIEAHAKLVKGLPVPGFHRLPVLLQGDPTSQRREGARTVYRWDALKPGAVPNNQGPDFSARLAAEATVATVGGRPVLEQVRVFAPEPFAIMAVARMNAFESVTRYGFAAGRHRLEAQDNRVDARIPFRGQGVTVTRATFGPLSGG